MELDRSFALQLKTVQGNSLKSLFEVLKELLNDVNIVADPTGIKIIALDSAQVTLCHCFLESSSFEVFHCPTPLVIGVNVQNMYKLLKPASSQDTLTMQIDEAASNDLEIIIQNSEKKSKTFFKLKLLDIDDERVGIPNVEMTTCITMASGDFQRLIRDMLTIGNVLRIKVTREEVVFETAGDFCQPAHRPGDVRGDHHRRERGRDRPPVLVEAALAVLQSPDPQHDLQLVASSQLPTHHPVRDREPRAAETDPLPKVGVNGSTDPIWSTFSECVGLRGKACERTDVKLGPFLLGIDTR